MRLVVFFVFVLIIIAVAASSFFILQFDPNTLRPQFEAHLGRILQSKVELASISIKWNFVPTLEMNGIRVLEPESNEPLLESEKVRVAARLFPLIRKELVLQSLELESPRIIFLRRKDKTWNWNISTLDASLNEAQPVQKAKAAPEPIQLESVSALHAKIEYRDETVSPHYYFRIVDMNIKGLQTGGPGESFSMRFQMPLNPSQQIVGSLSIDSLTRTLMLQMAAGSQFFVELRGENIFEALRFQMKGFYQDFPGQSLPSEVSRIFAAKGVSMDFEGTGEGYQPMEWARSLSLKGRFSLKEGRFQGVVNVPKQILDQLATMPMPRFSDLRLLDFPLDFDETLRGTTTPFQECTGKLQWSESKLFLDEVLLQHGDYHIQLSGFVNSTDRYINLRGASAFSVPVSRIISDMVPDMQVLQNSQGEVLIPIEYRGTFPEADIFVDFDFVSNRLVQMRGEELASLGIQKLNEFLEAHRR